MLPILVLGFVRLDSLRATIESILSQDHGPIYVSCDGPPLKHYSQAMEVQRYVESLHASGISSSNQGIFRAVSNGVSWFFESVRKGIIIEDDLVIKANFLKSVEFASRHLDNYKVVAIGLHNSVPERFIKNVQKPLRSSRFVISWGWVTTREKWESRIKSYGDVNYFKLFFKMTCAIGLSSAIYHLYYYRKRVHMEKNNILKCTWADLWQINAFMKNLIVLTFNKNFVDNIGFDEFATHTFRKDFSYPIQQISNDDLIESKYAFKISVIDANADKYFMRKRKVSTIIREKLRLKSRLRNVRLLEPK